jgi:outer membrane receptor for monomeric catechols
MSQYDVTAFTLKSFLRSNPDATRLSRRSTPARITSGTTMWGASVDDGPDGPKKPIFASAYLLDKIELEDLVINVGLRWDYIDTDTKQFVDPSNVKFDDDGMISTNPRIISRTVIPHRPSVRVSASPSR